MSKKDKLELNVLKLNDYYLFYLVMADRYDTEDSTYYAKKSRVLKMRLDKLVKEYEERYEQD